MDHGDLEGWKFPGWKATGQDEPATTCWRTCCQCSPGLAHANAGAYTELPGHQLMLSLLPF